MSSSKVTAATVADDEPSHPGSGKKLKQACLPFKLLVNSPGTAGVKCRKRKLSGSENDETRVANAQVEPVNGGAKRFIMSDGQDPDGGDDALTVNTPLAFGPRTSSINANFTEILCRQQLLFTIFLLILYDS